MNTDWLDRSLYPFASHYFDLPAGRLHYLDEGGGNHTVVMVHGNPAWSFTYRELVNGLATEYRCLAPDHLGFGLSDKPPDWDYLPASHAENLEQLLNRQVTGTMTLVVGDWGGPIGLSYALKYPERITSLVITNSWLWRLNGDPHYELFSRLMGGPIGRYLIRRYNFFARVLMKQMFRTELPASIHRHYLEPLAEPGERRGCWVFPGQILGSGDWLESLWNRRQAIVAKPALILWGAKDIAFREKELNRWISLFDAPEVHRFESHGHFIPEELGTRMVPLVRDHLRKTVAPAG